MSSVNISTNITTITPSYQPILERGLRRLDTENSQTGSSVQERGAKQLKNAVTDTPLVDRAADAGITTGQIIDIQV